MAILKPAVKLIVRESAHYQLKGPLLSLGVPEVYATMPELRRWLPEYAGREVTLSESAVQQSTNKFGSRLGWVDARTFFSTLGIEEFHSLDLPDCEYPAEIIHDLNEPLPEKWNGKYETIMDPGTLEHVFDVRTCLTNIVSALAVGGVVCHLVPVYSYNGGYYSINPNVLVDFYRQNAFTDIKAFVLMWDRYWPFSSRKTQCYVYREDVLGSRHALTEADQFRYTPHLLLFARKQAIRLPLVSPLQFGGAYMAGASALPQTRAQALEARGKKIAAGLRNIIPLHLALRLQTAVYRRLVRWRARREAGFRI